MQTDPEWVISIASKPSPFILLEMSLCAILTLAGAISLGLAKPGAYERELAHI